MQAGLAREHVELDERARRGPAAHEPSRTRPHGRGGHQRLLRGSKCDTGGELLEQLPLLLGELRGTRILTTA